MPKATVMLGRIACGKSFHAKEIAARQGGVILSCDELIHSVFDSCPGDRLPSIEEGAMEYLLSVAGRLYAEGCDVIVDFPLTSAKAREYVCTKLQRMGFQVFRVLVRCDEQLRHSRLNKRNLQRAGGKSKNFILSYQRVLEIEAARYEEPRDNEFDSVIQND